GVRGGGDEVLHRRLHEVAGLVAQLRRHQAVGGGVGVLDIADAAARVAHAAGDALIAAGAVADRPADRGGGTDLVLPLGRDGGEVGGEDEGRARAIRAIDRRDGDAGQVHARVQRGDALVVPA